MQGSDDQAGAYLLVFLSYLQVSTRIFLLCVGLLLFPLLALAQNSPSTYLQELLQLANKKHLHQQRYWHLLLHYRQDFLGGYTSEVDDPGFFLSENGKTDPKGELHATLAQFFSRELVGRSEQVAQCAFIARFQWLRDQLRFDETRFPVQRCERFDNWLKELNPASITMIFPSAFMDNPVSMFGHTFLRIDQQGQTEHTRILAYTINYAAEVPPDVGMEFALKGIFGGYHGFFSTIPYYVKVQEYRDIENRDMWEYRLQFSHEQIHRLLMHTWEMGNAYFEYFFFKENCAYHILSLLEVADPLLHLTDQFHFLTIPADTIRPLIHQEDLVRSISYRPAGSTKLKRKRATVHPSETRFLDQLTHDPSVAQHIEFLRLPQERQMFLLDLASDYLRYKSRTDKNFADVYNTNNQSILLNRSQINVPSAAFHVRPFTRSPEQGHDTARMGVGFGWRNDELFEHIDIRAVYHDLLDPDPGYTLDSQIELGHLAVRHYHGRNQFRIEQFTLANVLSLAPIDSWFRWPSWKISIEMNTVKTRSCDLCSNGHFNVGAGGAVETHFFQREVFFLFGEADANVSGAYDENHRVGGGMSGGVVANITDKWKWLASGGYVGYLFGDRSDDVKITIGQRWTFAKNLALRTTFTHHDRDNELLAVVHGYF